MQVTLVQPQQLEQTVVEEDDEISSIRLGCCTYSSNCELKILRSFYSKVFHIVCQWKMLNILAKINSNLPFGLKLLRVVQLIVGIVFLISGLGSTAFWAFKYFGNEIFVPFGLSTFRALNWPLSDFALIFCCFYAAFTVGLATPSAKRGCVVGGLAFIIQGLLGFYVDSSSSTRQQFGVEATELQPLVLDLWFVGWGALTIWIGVVGFPMLSKLELQSL